MSTRVVQGERKKSFSLVKEEGLGRMVFDEPGVLELIDETMMKMPERTYTNPHIENHYCSTELRTTRMLNLGNSVICTECNKRYEVPRI